MTVSEEDKPESEENVMILTGNHAAAHAIRQAKVGVVSAYPITPQSPVVEKILGPFFLGVLIVDAWGAYNKIVCEKQTCTAHIFRKIRKSIEAFPQYKTDTNIDPAKRRRNFWRR